MSTAEARVAQTPASAAPFPALATTVGDRVPRIEVSRRGEPRVNAHCFFFGLGYLGLVVIVAGAWAQASNTDAVTLFGLGGLCVGLGGFGVLVHTLWKPNDRKVRHLLLAIASLVLVVASVAPVGRVSREVHAAALVPGLQPLADAVLRDARIRKVGVSGNGEVTLNGFHGPRQGSGGWMEGPEPIPSPIALDEVLARDGISRRELDAYVHRLEAARVAQVARAEDHVLFSPRNVSGHRLLYVRPGTALPPPSALLDDYAHWRSQPLGGGWYLVLRGRRP